MTRSKLIIGALAAITLIPSLSIITSTDAAAWRRPANGVGAIPLGGKYALRNVLYGPNRVYLRFLHDRARPTTSNMPMTGGAGAAMRAIMNGRH